MVETGGQVASAKRLISETLSADCTAADRPLAFIEFWSVGSPLRRGRTNFMTDIWDPVGLFYIVEAIRADCGAFACEMKGVETPTPHGKSPS